MRPARLRQVPVLTVLIGILAASAGCVSWGSSDHTITHAAPEAPDSALWQPGAPVLDVVFDRAEISLDRRATVRDAQAEEGFRRRFLRAGVFASVRRHAAPDARARVRFERHYVEEEPQAANLLKAALIPGLSGYRFGVASTWRLHLEREDEPTKSYEVHTSLTRVYFGAGVRDGVRTWLYRRVDELNFQGLVHRMRIDPELFASP